MSGMQGGMPPMPQGGQGMMPQGGQMPQLPPQVLQMLMQHMQQGGGQMPGGPMQGGPMPGGQGPMGMPGGQPMPAPQGPGMGPGGGSPFGAAPGLAQRLPPPGAPMQPGGQQGMPGGQGPMQQPGQQGAPPGQQPMTPPQMAAQGRGGDSIVAHLTPGEIQIPPQVQTPQLLAAIKQAFAKVGVLPQQFQAGSPVSSHNPATGAPEYNLFSAILPVLGAAAGSFIPGVGTAVGMGLGGAAGGAAGSAMSGGSASQIALSGLGGGAGGYIGGSGGIGSLLNGSGSAAPGAAGAATNAGFAASDNAASLNAHPVLSGASSAPFFSPDTAASLNAHPVLSGAVGMAPGEQAPSLLSQIPIKGAMTAGLGSTIGGMFGSPPNQKSALPAGFNNNLPPLNPQFGQLNGSGVQNTPTFAGYNPYTSSTQSGFNFYPKTA